MSAIDRTVAGFVRDGTEMLATAAHNGSGNGKNGNHKIWLEGLGFGLAEAVSMAVAFGTFAAVEQMPRDMVNGVTNAIGKYCIEPVLDPLEYGFQKICHLDECKVDQNVSREKRAQNVARTLFLFGVSGAAALESKFLTRRVMNHKFGINNDKGKIWEIWKMTRKEGIILMADEGVHYGSIIAANTVMAGTTDQVIRSVRDVMVSCGMPEDKAHELASYATVWELPNLLGLMAGLGAIYATHKYPRALGVPPAH